MSPVDELPRWVVAVLRIATVALLFIVCLAVGALLVALSVTAVLP